MFGAKTRSRIGKATTLAATIGLFSLGAVFGWFGREQYIVTPASPPSAEDHREAVPTLLGDINTKTSRQEAQPIASEGTPIENAIALSNDVGAPPAADEQVSGLLSRYAKDRLRDTESV